MTLIGHVLLLSALGSQTLATTQPAGLPASGAPRAEQVAVTPDSASNPSLGDAMRASQFGLGLNYRLEWVDESADSGPVPKEALASTLRTTLSLTTGEWRRISAHLLVEDVTAVGNDLYNNRGAGSLDNGRTDRSVVADPENTELAEAYLQIRVGDDGRIRLGRQSINLDQQRFVGAVGWRQNHQEFDAATLDLAATGSWRLRAGYLDRVHTVTGAQIDLDAPYLEATGRLGPVGLVAHSLWLDDRNGRLSGGSRSTFGLRAHSSIDRDTNTWTFEGALARQADYADQPSDFQLDYFQISAAYRRGDWSASVGAELLEGDGTRAFQTPLATLHKFNGFADRFLVTPDDGLRDVFVGVKYAHGTLSVAITLHDFEADLGGVSYGDEIDVVASWKSDWNQTFALKAAHFSGDDLTRDTIKVMLWTSWSL